MPYLHCPRCHRNAWLRAERAGDVACRSCGTTLTPAAGNETAFLAGAVRARLARESRLTAGPPRFVRDPQRLAE
jgi:ribosomal protein S27E